MTDPEEGSSLGENQGDRFDRVPSTAKDRRVRGRPSRVDILEWWADRFGIPPSTFDGYSFWEKGAGSIWILRGDAPSPIPVEALGLRLLRTRQTYWKPTTNAVQRFGGRATRNVIDLSSGAAARFMAGEDVEVDWSGDWGYLIARKRVAGATAPLGVGLFTHGVLQSQIPKGRRRSLPADS